MHDGAGATTIMSNTNHCGLIDQVLKRLEGKLLVTSCSNKLPEDCGPFLRKLTEAADESRISDILDDVFDRVSTIFATYLKAVLAAAAATTTTTRTEDGGEVHSMEDTTPLVEGTALTAFNLITAEALPFLTSSHECRDLPSWVEGVSWCRLGSLLVCLIREATDGFQSPTVRLRWHHIEGEELQPMLSAVVLVWEVVVRLLSFVVNCIEFGEEEDAHHSSKPHPLLHIISDCFVAMVENNNKLQVQASTLPNSVDVLCVFINNYMWIKQQCRHLPMFSATEVLALVDGYTAGALQDLLNCCTTELQHIISKTTSPAVDGECQSEILFHRIISLCRCIRGVAPPIPRQEVTSLLLERTLRPLVERLLDGEKKRDVPSLSVVTRALRAFGDVQRVAGGSFFLQDLAGKVTGSRSGSSGDIRGNVGIDGDVSESLMARRLSEVLQFLEEEPVFGTRCCQQSPSFCTLRRLFLDVPS